MGRDGMPTPAGTLVDGQQHGSPLRDDVLHIDELPLGQARSAAYQMMREAGPVVRDAQGAYVVTDAESASYVLRHPELFPEYELAPGASTAADWPAALVGLDHLHLVFRQTSLSSEGEHHSETE